MITATSVSGKCFLILGTVATISVVMAMMWGPLLLGMEPKGVYLAGYFFFLIAVILAFPISIAVFPWLYATRWHVDEDKIVFWVPAPKMAGKSWELKNGEIESLRPGWIFYSVYCKDGSSFKLPRHLSARNKPLQAVVEDGRLALKTKKT